MDVTDINFVGPSLRAKVWFSSVPDEESFVPKLMIWMLPAINI